MALKNFTEAQLVEWRVIAGMPHSSDTNLETGETRALAEWEQALTRACYTVAGGGEEDTIDDGWQDLARACIAHPGIAGLEAAYRLGGDHGLIKLAEERWALMKKDAQGKARDKTTA